MSDVFLNHFLLNFWSRISHGTNSEAHRFGYIGWSVSPRNPPASTSPASELQVQGARRGCLCVCCNPNSSSHDRPASTLPTQPQAPLLFAGHCRLLVFWALKEAYPTSTSRLSTGHWFIQLSTPPPIVTTFIRQGAFFLAGLVQWNMQPNSDQWNLRKVCVRSS